MYRRGVHRRCGFMIVDSHVHIKGGAYYRRHENVRSCIDLAKVRAYDFSPEELDRILAGNILELMDMRPAGKP
jgi:hypothetical protein